MKKKITLIKLGGSIITNKEVPMLVREQILTRLVEQISKARKKSKELFIVGHGQGSFAHAPAMRYKTKQGFIFKDSIIGMAITQDSAAQLNRIVVKNFLAAQIPAVSFLFSNSLVTENEKASHWCNQVLLEYLEKGLLPVTDGDVIVDSVQGSTIWSTEKIFGYIAKNLPIDRFEVNRIIHVTEVGGVLDGKNNIIKKVSIKNKDKIKKHIINTKGFDVTGGMWHKIEESLSLANQGISSCIISGLKKNNLYNCLMGEGFIGTTIENRFKLSKEEV